MPELERTFGANGETISEEVIAGAQEIAEAAEAVPEAGEPVQNLESAGEGQEEAPKAPTKIRIGDQTFDSQADALAYANKIVEDNRLADAYSKGLLDAQQARVPAPGVTPEVPEPEKFDEEKFYGNPQQFLKEYGEKIVSKTLGTVEQQAELKRKNDQLWSEFSNRHPDLADFRADVERFATDNSQPLQAVVAVKGLTGGYDYLATKVREYQDRIVQARKPKRDLPNTGGGASPGGAPTSVTPKKAEKAPLTWHEQLALHRKSKR